MNHPLINRLLHWAHDDDGVWLSLDGCNIRVTIDYVNGLIIIVYKGYENRVVLNRDKTLKECTCDILLKLLTSPATRVY